MTIKNLTIREEQGHWKRRSWIRFSLASPSNPPLSDRAAIYRALMPEIVREVRERIGITIDADSAAWGTATKCSCGCSPGCVLERDRNDLLVRVEVESRSVDGKTAEAGR